MAYQLIITRSYMYMTSGATTLSQFSAGCHNRRKSRPDETTVKYVLNATPMMIARLPPYSRISSYMINDLHWVPISTHVTYKDMFLVAKSQLCLASKYLCELKLLPAPSTCQLCPVDYCDLPVAWSRTALFQNRAFAVVRPALWNDTPLAFQSVML